MSNNTVTQRFGAAVIPVQLSHAEINWFVLLRIKHSVWLNDEKGCLCRQIILIPLRTRKDAVIQHHRLDDAAYSAHHSTAR
jgi:hypothetical protein